MSAPITEAHRKLAVELILGLPSRSCESASVHGAAQLIADSEAKACELALAKSFSEYPVRMTLKEQDDARADCDQLRADRDYTRPLLDEMEALERELADAQRPEKCIVITAYGSAENLAFLVKQRGIAPHIPVFDKSNRTDGTLSRSDFAFDPDLDRYTCPAGKHLVQFHRTYATPRSGITKEGTRIYRASKRDCDACEFKPRCCPNTPARKIPRDLDEDARDVARALARTPAYERSRHRRKKVEMLFAHLKRILRLGRLRLRGPCGARDEFLLAATAQNLRKLAKLGSIIALA